MSTKANIMVTDLEGKTTQYYHHHDGYPTYMGKMLETFATAATFLPESDDEAFKKLLEMKGSFELDTDNIHNDISYCWYVEINYNKIVISYCKVEDDDDIKKLLRCVEGRIIL